MLFKAHELATAMCPAGWTRVRLAEIAQEVSVRAGHDTALPVLSVTKHRGIVKAEDYFSKAVHGRDTSNYKIVRSGDFAYATIHLDEGSLGRHTDTPSGIVSPMYTVFEVTAGFDPYYLETLLRSPKSIVTYGSLGQGTVNRRASISFSAFSGLVLQHPPLPEQKKIAAILSSVDEVIAKTEAVIAQLQIVKKAMMEQLLTKGMPGRHTRFKQTELGEIPEEWEVVRAGELCEVITKGATPKVVTSASPDCVPFLRVQNIGRRGEIDLSGSALFVTERTHTTELMRSQIRPGDVLMNIVGPPLGKVAVVPISIPKANINQAIALLRPARIESEYLSLCLTAEHLFAWLLKQAKRTSTQLNLTLESCREFPLPLPDQAERREIIACTVAMQLTLDAQQTELVALREVKSSLSSSLLSGEIRVAAGVA